MTERTSRGDVEAMLARLDATGIEDEYLFVERRIYRRLLIKHLKVRTQ